MMDGFYSTATNSAVPTDGTYYGWMNSHMSWMLGPNFAGMAFFGMLTMVLVDILLVLLIIYLWKLIQKK